MPNLELKVLNAKSWKKISNKIHRAIKLNLELKISHEKYKTDLAFLNKLLEASLENIMFKHWTLDARDYFVWMEKVARKRQFSGQRGFFNWYFRSELTVTSLIYLNSSLIGTELLGDSTLWFRVIKYSLQKFYVFFYRTSHIICN